MSHTESCEYLTSDRKVESQKRWLLSYKSRKDDTLNLVSLPCRYWIRTSRTKLSQVFSLVTQQDIRTSNAIAEETKADGAAMKTIAAPTMVFLPGTFWASVSSMPMLEEAEWSLHLAIAVPLTGTVVSCWWLWVSRPRFLGRLTRRRMKGVEKML